MLQLRRQVWITLPALRRGAVASVLVGGVWVLADGLQQLCADVPVWSEDALAFGVVLGLLALPLVANEVFPALDHSPLWLLDSQ